MRSVHSVLTTFTYSMRPVTTVDIVGIGAVEERVEGNRPVKGATMGFQKNSSKHPYDDD